jgi:hypothetical protein
VFYFHQKQSKGGRKKKKKKKQKEHMSKMALVAGALLLVFVVLAGLSKTAPGYNLQGKTIGSSFGYTHCDALARQIHQVFLIGERTSNPLAKLMYATTAASKIHTLFMIGSVDRTSRRCNLDLATLKTDVEKMFEQAKKEIGQSCPDLFIREDEHDFNMNWFL